MPRLPRVKLHKQVKVNDKWTRATALFDSKGRVRRDHVLINAKDETPAEGSYFIEWWDQGKRHREAAGADAQDAADKARVRDCVHSGFLQLLERASRFDALMLADIADQKHTVI